jgi:hypothetical protein
MKNIDELINEHFIKHDYKLETFVETFYDNKEYVERLKQSLVKQIN